MRESEVLKICMLASAECGATVFRNNRGAFRTLDGKRIIRAGLEARGSADLIGFTQDGRFLAIECKNDKGKISKDQEHFMHIVNSSGGIAFIARNAEDVRTNLCKLCIAGMQK